MRRRRLHSSESSWRGKSRSVIDKANNENVSLGPDLGRGKAGVVFDKANKGNLRPDGQKVGITADDKFISGIHVETAEDLSGEGVEMCTKFEDGALGNKCVNIEMPLSEKKKSVVSLNECKDGEGTACLISDAAVTNLMDASSISSTTLFTLYLVDVCVTNGQKQKKWKRLARHKGENEGFPSNANLLEKMDYLMDVDVIDNICLKIGRHIVEGIDDFNEATLGPNNCSTKFLHTTLVQKPSSTSQPGLSESEIHVAHMHRVGGGGLGKVRRHLSPYLCLLIRHDSHQLSSALSSLSRADFFLGPTAAHGRHVGNDPVSELRTNLGRRLVGSHDTAAHVTRRVDSSDTLKRSLLFSEMQMEGSFA
ncbi:hypothetical protein ACOSQ4_025159 [Xanthoceras sorbifolium]